MQHTGTSRKRSHPCKFLVGVVALLVTLVVLGSNAVLAGVMLFDDFSEEAPASNGTPGNPRRLQNWDVTSGYIDLMGVVTDPSSRLYTYPAQGLFLDMDGSGFTAVNTIVSKMLFDFEPGNQYTLSFATWGWRSFHQGDPTDLLSISIPGLFQSQLTIAQTDLLTRHSYTFSPSSAMTSQLIFEHDGNSDNIGPCLDDIQLSVGVPEPSTLALAGCGFAFAAVVSFRRRRRRLNMNHSQRSTDCRTP